MNLYHNGVKYTTHFVLPPLLMGGTTLVCPTPVDVTIPGWCPMGPPLLMSQDCQPLKNWEKSGTGKKASSKKEDSSRKRQLQPYVEKQGGAGTYGH